MLVMCASCKHRQSNQAMLKLSHSSLSFSRLIVHTTYSKKTQIRTKCLAASTTARTLIYLRIPNNKRSRLRTQLVSTTDARCRCSHSSRLHDNSTPSKHIKIGNMCIKHSKSAAKAIHVHIKSSMLRRFSA